jgi:hypothetical protein
MQKSRTTQIKKWGVLLTLPLVLATAGCGKEAGSTQTSVASLVTT